MKCFAKCDTVQNRAIRFYLGLHKYTPLPALHGEMGWKPPMYRHMTNILRFWNKLVNMDDSRLTKQIFNWDYQSRHGTWTTEVKQIFTTLSVPDYFVTRTPIDRELANGLINNVLYLDWLHNLHVKPKLTTYVLFKHDFVVESYICKHYRKQARSLIAQLRSGVLPP